MYTIILLLLRPFATIIHANNVQHIR